MSAPRESLIAFVPAPDVKKRCIRCERSWAQYPGGTWHNYVSVINAATGTEHAQGWGDGMTVCGLDAKGDQWWWPC